MSLSLAQVYCLSAVFFPLPHCCFWDSKLKQIVLPGLNRPTELHCATRVYFAN